MGLVLEAGVAHALPLPPQSNGWQRSRRDSVRVLCVIKLLKTKIRVQVPAWWDRGVPSGSGGSAHQNVVWELLGVTGLLSAWLQGCCSSCSEGVGGSRVFHRCQSGHRWVGAPCSHDGCLTRPVGQERRKPGPGALPTQDATRSSEGPV